MIANVCWLLIKVILKFPEGKFKETKKLFWFIVEEKTLRFIANAKKKQKQNFCYSLGKAWKIKQSFKIIQACLLILSKVVWVKKIVLIFSITWKWKLLTDKIKYLFFKKYCCIILNFVLREFGAILLMSCLTNILENGLLQISVFSSV